jgi:molecular chaperone DnaK (HSP70)
MCLSSILRLERSSDLYPCHRFSGAAYTIQHPGDGPQKSSISIVRNWTGKLPGDVSSSKVPSVIAYNVNGKIIWGFEALHSSTRQKFQWMKLLLEPELPLKPSEVMDLEEIKRLLASQGKTAIQVASDYLKCLWEHVVAQICEDYGQGTFDFASKRIVLTVPAVWTPAARHNTFQVAAGAGLVCDDYDLQIISEPEAAATAILKDRENVVKVCDPLY